MIALFNTTKKNSVNSYILIIPFLIIYLFILCSFADGKEYYKWTDDKGTTHVTDNRDHIPESFEESAEIYEDNFESSFSDHLNIIVTYIKEHSFSVFLSLLLLNFALLLYLLLFGFAEYVAYKFNRSFKALGNRASGNDDEIFMRIDDLRNIIRQYLENKGYEVYSDNEPYGIFDFVVRKGRREIGVNVNNNINPVSRTYLNELYNECTRLGIEESAVYTTSIFENDVEDYARRINCSLYDSKFIAKILTSSEVSRSQNP